MMKKRKMKLVNIIKTEESCMGLMTYYDKNKNSCCGYNLSKKEVECEFLKNVFCNNDYRIKTLVKYEIKK